MCRPRYQSARVFLASKIKEYDKEIEDKFAMKDFYYRILDSPHYHKFTNRTRGDTNFLADILEAQIRELYAKRDFIEELQKELT